MKISKLFHWLYAIIMLLPVAFIGVRCLYVIFNKNAKDSYSGEATYEINYKYQSNEVTNEDDLVIGNIYCLKTDGMFIDDIVSEGNYIAFYLVNDNLNFQDALDHQENIIPPYISPSKVLMLETHTMPSIAVYEDEYSLIYGDYTDYYLYQEVFDGDIIIKLLDFSEINDIQLITYTDYNEIESVNIDTSGTLDNAFIYSVNEINTQPLFSWAKNSFLVTPISYITVLFGLDAQSPINTMLSYWLAISIIWLVFDLIMYVPLLVHRWLDKGILE